MAANFRLEVYTPQRAFFADAVEAIVLTLEDGEAAIYANHSLVTAPVVPCLLKIKNRNGEWKTAFIAEGLLEVTSHKTVLLSNAAEWPDEIDNERAKEAKARAEETLKSAMLKFEIEAASASLKRANMRLRAKGESLK